MKLEWSTGAGLAGFFKARMNALGGENLNHPASTDAPALSRWISTLLQFVIFCSINAPRGSTFGPQLITVRPVWRFSALSL
jgi:hypothetical protein